MYDYFDLSKISVILFSEWKYENTILLEIFAMIEQNHPIRDEEKKIFILWHFQTFYLWWAEVALSFPPEKLPIQEFLAATTATILYTSLKSLRSTT